MNTSLRRKSKRPKYPSDISDKAWSNLRPLLPRPKVTKEKGGRPPADPREIINGIFYVVRTGCSWRSMPHDLPKWQTCYGYFRSWSMDGTWVRINSRLVKRVRRKVHGRKVRPSAGIIDSQSCKTTSCGGDWIGFDNAKKVRGRKRFILTDTEGLLLAVWICAASVSEKAGAMQLIRYIRMTPPLKKLCGRLKLVWGDAGFRGGALESYAKKYLGCAWTAILRPKNVKGFILLPRRWVVERTFAWVLNARRLSRDYEKTRHSAQAMVFLAILPLMLKRLEGF